MQDAAPCPPGHAVHDRFAVRSARGVAEPADAVLLGDQSPDGAAGDPRPPPDTDPAPSQQHEASRARATNPVRLGQIMVTANRLGGVWRGGSAADLTMVKSDAPSVRVCCPAGKRDPMRCSILLGLRGSGGGGKRDHDAAELGALSLVQRPVGNAGLTCGTDAFDLGDLVGRQA